MWGPQVLRVFFSAKNPLDLMKPEFCQHEDCGDGNRCL